MKEALPIPEGTEGIPEGYQLVPVETGIADSTNTEILGGLEEGTEVFLAGPSESCTPICRMTACQSVEEGALMWERKAQTPDTERRAELSIDVQRMSKIYNEGRENEVRALDDISLAGILGRVSVHSRTVRLGQVHADEHSRLSGYPDLRLLSSERAGGRAT